MSAEQRRAGRRDATARGDARGVGSRRRTEGHDDPHLRRGGSDRALLLRELRRSRRRPGRGARRASPTRSPTAPSRPWQAHEGGPAERVRAGIGAFVQILTDDPRKGRVAIVESVAHDAVRPRTGRAAAPVRRAVGPRGARAVRSRGVERGRRDRWPRRCSSAGSPSSSRPGSRGVIDGDARRAGGRRDAPLHRDRAPLSGATRPSAPRRRPRPGSGRGRAASCVAVREVDRRTRSPARPANRTHVSTDRLTMSQHARRDRQDRHQRHGGTRNGRSQVAAGAAQDDDAGRDHDEREQRADADAAWTARRAARTPASAATKSAGHDRDAVRRAEARVHLGEAAPAAGRRVTSRTAPGPDPASARARPSSGPRRRRSR